MSREDTAVRAVPGRIGWHYCIITDGDKPKGRYAYSANEEHRALARFIDCGMWLDEGWRYTPDDEYEAELFLEILGCVEAEDIIDKLDKGS